MLKCKRCDAGDMALLPLAKAALKKVHRCSIMVNDLHPDNIVLVADGNMAGVFLLISAIQFHYQVLLSLKKSCVACRPSFPEDSIRHVCSRLTLGRLPPYDTV